MNRDSLDCSKVSFTYLPFILLNNVMLLSRNVGIKATHKIKAKHTVMKRLILFFCAGSWTHDFNFTISKKKEIMVHLFNSRFFACSLSSFFNVSSPPHCYALTLRHAIKRCLSPKNILRCFQGTYLLHITQKL